MFSQGNTLLYPPHDHDNVWVCSVNWTDPVVNKKCTKALFCLSPSVVITCTWLTEKQTHTPPLLLCLMRKPAESVFSTIVDTLWKHPNIIIEKNQKVQIFADKHIIYTFPNMVLRFWTICVINTGPQQDVHSLSKWLLFVCRSISVPYAYQCCAFVGCDSMTSSSEENDVKKSTGGNAAVRGFSLEQLTC